MSSTRATQNSHRGTDFGIAAAYMQGHETSASTVRSDEVATEQPIPDLFESDIESTQLPTICQSVSVFMCCFYYGSYRW